MRTAVHRSAPPLLLLVLCTACGSVPQHRDAPPLPAAYSRGAADSPTGPQDARWYAGFGSPELDALLAAADTGSLDVAAASARLRQAAARARAAHAGQLPQVDAGGSATRYSGRSDGSSATETDWAALLSASYELDFWGRNRATSRSASALAAASASDLATVRLATRAAVASTYFQVLSLRERAAAALEDLQTARDVLSVIEARHAGGAASASELAAQRAAVATASLVEPDLRQQESIALATLAVLVGRDPEGFEVKARGLSNIVEPPLAAGLPAELLRRRPDIAAAEATLAAADADVEVARTAFLPSITLTAAGGVQNPAVQAAVTTLAGTGSTFTVGASLLQAVFDGGRRSAMREEASARAEEMLLAYRSAIRNALLDVEAALAQRESLDAQQVARGEALGQSRTALEAARARHSAGSGDYLSLLEAQRTLHQVRDADLQYRLSRLQSAIGLAKALGGGWQANSALPRADEPTLSDRKP